MRQDVYSGNVQLHGEESEDALLAAMNYGASLTLVGRFEEAKSLLRKVMPVAQRIFGESDRTTLTMRKIFAEASYKNPGAKLDDLREAVTTLEDVERTARRVLGGAHPLVGSLESSIRRSRKALQTREASPGTA